MTNIECLLRYDKAHDMFCFVLDTSLCIKEFGSHYKVFIYVREHDSFEVVKCADDFNSAYREVIALYNDIKSFSFGQSTTL